MEYNDLLETFGTMSKAARALDLPRQTVHAWKEAGIPFEQQFRIQLKTKGRLKAKMPDLMPRRRRTE